MSTGKRYTIRTAAWACGIWMGMPLGFINIELVYALQRHGVAVPSFCAGLFLPVSWFLGYFADAKAVRAIDQYEREEWERSKQGDRPTRVR